MGVRYVRYGIEMLKVELSRFRVYSARNVSIPLKLNKIKMVLSAYCSNLHKPGCNANHGFTLVRHSMYGVEMALTDLKKKAMSGDHSRSNIHGQHLIFNPII